MERQQSKLLNSKECTAGEGVLFSYRLLTGRHRPTHPAAGSQFVFHACDIYPVHLALSGVCACSVTTGFCHCVFEPILCRTINEAWRFGGNLPCFCLLDKPPAILGSEACIWPSCWQGESWAEIAVSVETKWVNSLSDPLSRAGPTSKCNNYSLWDEQNGRFTSARPMAQMRGCGKSPCSAGTEMQLCKEALRCTQPHWSSLISR